MKKLVMLICVVLISASVFAAPAAEDTIKIGITKIVAHPALDAVEQGIQDELAERREKFQQFLNSNPSVGVSILNILSSRLRAADEARKAGSQTEKRLTNQLSELTSEKQRLQELQRLQDETSHLIMHDLRNPLSMIIGGASLLELTLPEDVLQANRDILDMLNSNVERMKRLVESLLDVTRMEAGEILLAKAAHSTDHQRQRVAEGQHGGRTRAGGQT